MVKIYKFVTSTVGVYTLAPLRSFYVHVYIGLYLCVCALFLTLLGETARIPVQNHCAHLADG